MKSQKGKREDQILKNKMKRTKERKKRYGETYQLATSSQVQVASMRLSRATRLYRRPASNLFAQERLAELVEETQQQIPRVWTISDHFVKLMQALPRPRSLVQLVPVQHAKLEARI